MRSFLLVSIVPGPRKPQPRNVDAEPDPVVIPVVMANAMNGTVLVSARIMSLAMGVAIGPHMTRGLAVTVVKDGSNNLAVIPRFNTIAPGVQAMIDPVPPVVTVAMAVTCAAVSQRG